MPTEFWLSYNNNEHRFQLPVNPSELTVKGSMQNQTISVQGLGETTIINDPAARIFTFSSFLPTNWGPYVCTADGKFWRPYDYVGYIEYWKVTKRPIRFIVTGTPLNFAVTIEDFTYSEKGGDVGTLYYEFTLKEYKFIKVKEIDVSDTSVGKPVVIDESKARPSDKESANTYTVKSGDSLWKIAKAELGDGEKYPTIASLNGIKAPYLIHPGDKLRLK